MRRSASEILHDLEMRVARLEEANGKTASGPTKRFDFVLQNIESRYKIRFTENPIYKGRSALSFHVYVPDDKEIKETIKNRHQFYFEDVEGASWHLNWRR
jgi:hypothetical protein